MMSSVFFPAGSVVSDSEFPIACCNAARKIERKRRAARFLSRGILGTAAGSGVARTLIVRFDVRGRFASGGNILGAGDLHDFLGAFHRFGRIAMHGQQNAALLHASFVTLRFILGDAEADQRTGESTDGAADTDARESRHDWSGS